MLARVGADELTEWKAEYNLKPWGEDRADFGASMVAWMVYQANKGKDAPDRPRTEFLPKFDEDEEGEGLTPEQLRAKLLGVTAAVGGMLNG